MLVRETDHHHTQFTYECPKCAARLSVDEHERGQPVRCPNCDVVHSAPCFRTFLHDNLRPLFKHDLSLTCPQCGVSLSVSHEESQAPVRCRECGREFEVPQPPWQMWWRPVSRVLSKRDRRYSLHHLMLFNTRRRVPDSFLDDRSKRRFQYYCGHCGRLYTARVWDIATQVECCGCGYTMVVPSPSMPGVPRLRSPEKAEVRDASVPDTAGASCYMT